MQSSIFGFLVLMAFGALWRLFSSDRERDAIRQAIASMVMNTFLPALTFSVLFRAPISAEIWQIPLLSGVLCLLLLGITFGSYHLVSWVSGSLIPTLSSSSFGALLLASAWCNATYLGLPITTLVLGEEAARIPILFDFLALTPLLLTVGTMIGGHYGTSTLPPGSSSFRSVLTLPPLWGAVGGLVFNLLQIPLPDFFFHALKLAGGVVAPLMIFSVGLALTLRPTRALLWTLPAIGIKLALSPLLAYGIGMGLGLQGEALSGVILEAAMPSMVLTLVLAERFKLDSELLAQTIALTTLLSFLTLPYIMSQLPS